MSVASDPSIATVQQNTVRTFISPVLRIRTELSATPPQAQQVLSPVEQTPPKSLPTYFGAIPQHRRGELPVPNESLARAWSAASNDNLIPIHLWSGDRRAIPFPAVSGPTPPVAAPTSGEITPATSGGGSSTLVSPATTQDTLAEHGVKIEDWKSAESLVDALGKPSVDILRKLARALVDRAILSHAKARETATLAGALTKVIDERWLPEMVHVFGGAVRIAALLRMKTYWSTAGGHIMAYADAASYEVLIDQGIIMAEFLGCLFASGVVTSDDVFIATRWLMQSPIALGRFQALHVLLDACRDGLADERTADWLWNLRNSISFRIEDGQYYWGMGGRADGLIRGICETIDDHFSGHTENILEDKPVPPFLSPSKIREGRRNIWRWYQAVGIVPRDDDCPYADPICGADSDVFVQKDCNLRSLRIFMPENANTYVQLIP